MRLLALVAVLAAGCAHVRPECSAHGGPPWLEVRSAHFVVHSNLGRADAERMTSELELALAGLHRAMRLDVPPTARVETVVFRSAGELQEVIEHDRIVGFWRTDWRGPLILMGGQSSLTGSDSDLATVKHELTHFVAAHHFGRQPRWFAEGLARYFETLTVDGEKKLVRSGQLESDSLYKVRMERLLPLEKLWRWGPPGSAPAAFESAAYASSWLWVHFLVNQHKERWKGFLDRLRQREEPRAAFEASFAGVELDEATQRYLELGEYRVTIAPLGAADTRLEVAPFADADVHALLARLAPSASKANELSKALQLDPGDVRALEEQAHEQKDKARRLELARALTTQHPTAAGFRILAAALPRKPEHRAERIAALEHAAELDPDSPLVTVDLARAYRENNQTKSAASAAARAVELMPWEPRAWFEHGVNLAAAGKCAEAISAGRRALELLPHGAKALAKALSGRVQRWEATCSQQRALQDDHRDREVDDEPGDVDERRDEGR